MAPITNKTMIPLIDTSEHIEEAVSDEYFFGKVRDALRWLHGSLMDLSSIVLEGAIDANPVDGAGVSTFIDANPTSLAPFGGWHPMAPDARLPGHEIEITSGAAAGTKYIIQSVSFLANSITITGQLLADGVLSGDTYRVFGHKHNGQDSEIVDFSGFPSPPDPDVFVKVGQIIGIRQGLCPSGYLAVAAWDDKYLFGTGQSPAANHAHGFNANTGNVTAGAFGAATINAAVLSAKSPLDFAGVHAHPSAPGNSQVEANNPIGKKLLFCQKT